MKHQIHTYLDLNADAETVDCRECGHEICGAEENYKNHCGVDRRPVSEAGPMFEQPDYIEDADSIEFRQFVCSNCGVLFDFEIAPDDQEYLHDIDVDVDSVKERF